MVTENCKKIEPVVVKLCSKTNIPLFLNTVYQYHRRRKPLGWYSVAAVPLFHNNCDKSILFAVQLFAGVYTREELDRVHYRCLSAECSPVI